VSAPAGELDYDLAASVTPGASPSPTDAGIELADAAPIVDHSRDFALWPLVAGVGAAFAVVVLGNHLGTGGRRDPEALV
jgi:hypothetical protein